MLDGWSMRSQQVEAASGTVKHSKHKHKFGCEVKNYGKRPATDLKVSAYFFEKIQKGEIGNSNLKGFDEDYSPKDQLLPDESTSFDYPFDIHPQEGLYQLNHTLLLILIEYFDDQTKMSTKSKTYKRFYFDGKNVRLFDLKGIYSSKSNEDYEINQINIIRLKKIHTEYLQ